MLLNTTHFGEVEVNPESIITFPQGLTGLPELTRFVLLHEERSNSSESPIVFWLQSLDEPEMSFNLIDPDVLGVNYEMVLTDEECALLQTQNFADLIVLLMVGTKEQSNELEAKPRLPFVINPNARVGVQKANIRPKIVFKSI